MADQTGTPQQVRSVIDTVRKNNVRAVFSESTVNTAPTKQVARETGAAYGGVLYVDSLKLDDGPVPTCLDLLRSPPKQSSKASPSEFTPHACATTPSWASRSQACSGWRWLYTPRLKPTSTSITSRFGNMLDMQSMDLWTSSIIGVFVSVALLITWKDLLLNVFDPAQARAIGLPTKLLHYGLLVILSLTIVTTLQAVILTLTTLFIVAFVFRMIRNKNRKAQSI